jgi:hypothetical protein
LTVKQKEALILSKGMRSVNDKMVDCIEIKAFYAIININADVVESAVFDTPTAKAMGFLTPCALSCFDSHQSFFSRKFSYVI